MLGQRAFLEYICKSMWHIRKNKHQPLFLIAEVVQEFNARSLQSPQDADFSLGAVWLDGPICRDDLEGMDARAIDIRSNALGYVLTVGVFADADAAVWQF